MTLRAEVKKRPRLFLFDVDGTLVDQGGSFYEGATDLIDALRQYGSVGLCSARPLASLVALTDELGPISWLSASQGALIAAPAKGGEQGSERWLIREASPLNLGQVKEIAARARGRGYECFYHGEDHWWVDRDTALSRAEARVCKVQPGLRAEVPDGVIYKIAVVARDGQLIDADTFPTSGFRAARSKPNYLEVTSASASAAKGADRIAALAEVAVTDILSVGDAENDFTMLSISGLAITFERAPERLTKAAHWILPNPEDGGLTRLLAKLPGE